MARGKGLAREDVLREEVKRLDALYAAAMGCAGDLKAVEVALKVCERKAKLLGLDAPASRADGAAPPPSEGILINDAYCQTIYERFRGLADAVAGRADAGRAAGVGDREPAAGA